MEPRNVAAEFRAIRDDLERVQRAVEQRKIADDMARAEAELRWASTPLWIRVPAVVWRELKRGRK